MKSWIAMGLFAGVLMLGAAEKYESAGFSAEIKGNGVITDLKYAGMPLAKELTIAGGYRIPAGMEKHDARFFQSWDYSNRAKYERKDNRLIVTVNSTLSSKKFKDAIKYQYICTFEPGKITITNELTQNVALSTDYNMFATQMIMPASLFGRGVKVLTGNGQEEFKVLPESYNPKFRLDGKSLAISTEKGVLSILPGKDDTFRYMDTRTWGGKDFIIQLVPPAKWTPKPVVHPAGTVWKWSYVLSFAPEK